MSPTEAQWTRFRVALVLGVFVLVWVAILGRAFQLQFLEREYLAGIDEREVSKVVELNPVRGDILDRKGEKLAVSLKTDSIFAHPAKIKDPAGTAAKLAKILRLKRQKAKFAFMTGLAIPGASCSRIRRISLPSALRSWAPWPGSNRNSTNAT